jgi:uncharacterized protein YcbK (DUF882 family)
VSNIIKVKRGADIDLSENFNSNEFDCKCKYPDCTFTFVDVELVQKLQQFRNKLGKKISLNCGYRCAKHNKDVGGVITSQHLQGIAADITVEGMDPADVAVQAQAFGFGGVGTYSTFTHVDNRDGVARWRG